MGTFDAASILGNKDKQQSGPNFEYCNTNQGKDEDSPPIFTVSDIEDCKDLYGSSEESSLTFSYSSEENDEDIFFEKYLKKKKVKLEIDKLNPRITYENATRMFELYILDLEGNEEKIFKQMRKEDVWHTNILRYSISDPIYLLGKWDCSDIEFTLHLIEGDRIEPLGIFKIDNSIIEEIVFTGEFEKNEQDDEAFICRGSTVSFNNWNFVKKRVPKFYENKHVLLFRSWYKTQATCFLAVENYSSNLSSDEVLVWTAYELGLESKYNHETTSRKELWKICKKEIMKKYFNPFRYLKFELICNWYFGKMDCFFYRDNFPMDLLKLLFSYFDLKVDLPLYMRIVFE
jgi:hypothetical protein